MAIRYPAIKECKDITDLTVYNRNDAASIDEEDGDFYVMSQKFDNGYHSLAHCKTFDEAKIICDCINEAARRAAYGAEYKSSKPQAAKGCGPVSYRQQA